MDRADLRGHRDARAGVAAGGLVSLSLDRRSVASLPHNGLPHRGAPSPECRAVDPPVGGVVAHRGALVASARSGAACTGVGGRAVPGPNGGGTHRNRGITATRTPNGRCVLAGSRSDGWVSRPTTGRAARLENPLEGLAASAHHAGGRPSGGS